MNKVNFGIDKQLFGYLYRLCRFRETEGKSQKAVCIEALNYVLVWRKHFHSGETDNLTGLSTSVSIWIQVRLPTFAVKYAHHIRLLLRFLAMHFSSFNIYKRQYQIDISNVMAHHNISQVNLKNGVSMPVPQRKAKYDSESANLAGLQLQAAISGSFSCSRVTTFGSKERPTV